MNHKQNPESQPVLQERPTQIAEGNRPPAFCWWVKAACFAYWTQVCCCRWYGIVIHDNHSKQTNEWMKCIGVKISEPVPRNLLTDEEVSQCLWLASGWPPQMKVRDLRASNRGQLSQASNNKVWFIVLLFPLKIISFMSPFGLLLKLGNKLRREKFLEARDRQTQRNGGVSRLAEIRPDYRNLVFLQH